jgi:cell division transport system ATP-binding protein
MNLLRQNETYNYMQTYSNHLHNQHNPNMSSSSGGSPELSQSPFRSKILHFDNVSKMYRDESIALQDVNLTIHPEEFVSVVGHSGAGKTTLLKMILAEERPTNGRVFFQETPIHSLSSSQMTKYRRKIGMVFQNFRLLAHKTAFENIAFAMEAAGRNDEEIESDVPYVLDLVDLKEKMWNFPEELSGGQKQRLAIARAIINQPDILIADEPTGNLDPVNTYEIVQILKKINDLGTTVILTTHNKGVVDTLKSRTITMERGQIVRDDPDGSYIY